MNEQTETKPKTTALTPRLDAYREQVLPPEKKAELWRSLPSHVRPEVFERNLMNALMANSDLINYPPQLVYREVAKAAGLGLLLDPLLGEAYMIEAYNYKTKRKEPQLRVGYKGMIKLARQAGNVTKVYAREVCQNDFLECVQGSEERLTHRPALFTDRGPIVGYYAVIGFNDGTFDFEPMSVAQCHEIRDRSDAWKAFKENKIRSTPWSTDDAEMSKKTTFRRLMKRQDQSPEMREAQKIEDQAEFPSMGHHPEEPRVATTVGLSGALDQLAGTQPAVEAEIVEETDDATQGDPRGDAPPVEGEVLEPGAEPSSPFPPAKGDMPDPEANPEDFLKWADRIMGKVKKFDDLHPLWENFIEPYTSGLFPPDRGECVNLYTKHKARLG